MPCTLGSLFSASMRASRSASAQVGGVGSSVACRPVSVLSLTLCGVDLAGRVVTDQDDGQAGLDALGAQRRGAAGDFGADGLGQGVAVDQLGGHGRIFVE
jgi:hypothetical protein